MYVSYIELAARSTRQTDFQQILGGKRIAVYG